jgi:hypothetical protein
MGFGFEGSSFGGVGSCSSINFIKLISGGVNSRELLLAIGGACASLVHASLADVLLLWLHSLADLLLIWGSMG